MNTHSQICKNISERKKAYTLPYKLKYSGTNIV